MKSPKDSSTTMVRLMMPTDANPAGNVYGGSILRYVDEVAGIVAYRHARTNVVTAAIDSMNFWSPVYVGNLLILKACVNYAGRTSMEVGVRIEAEDLYTGKTTHTGSSYLVLVALGKDCRPAEVPRLVPETPEEKARFDKAKKRQEIRMQRLKDRNDD